jgi:hypothetical protein
VGSAHSIIDQIRLGFNDCAEARFAESTNAELRLKLCCTDRNPHLKSTSCIRPPTVTSSTNYAKKHKSRCILADSHTALEVYKLHQAALTHQQHQLCTNKLATLYRI